MNHRHINAVLFIQSTGDSGDPLTEVEEIARAWAEYTGGVAEEGAYVATINSDNLANVATVEEVFGQAAVKCIRAADSAGGLSPYDTYTISQIPETRSVTDAIRLYAAINALGLDSLCEGVGASVPVIGTANLGRRPVRT